MTGIILAVFMLAILLSGAVLWLRGVPVKPPVVPASAQAKPTTPPAKRRLKRRRSFDPVLRAEIIGTLLDAGYAHAQIARQLRGNYRSTLRRVRAVARQKEAEARPVQPQQPRLLTPETATRAERAFLSRWVTLPGDPKDTQLFRCKVCGRVSATPDKQCHEQRQGAYVVTPCAASWEAHIEVERRYLQRPVDERRVVASRVVEAL